MKIFLLKKIHNSLIIHFFLVIMISIAITGLILIIRFNNYYMINLKNQLIMEASLIEFQIKDLISNDRQKIDGIIKKLGAKASYRITVINVNGEVIGDSEKDIAKMENHIDRTEVRAAIDGSVCENRHFSKTLKIYMYYISVPVIIKSKVAVVIRMSMPLSHVRKETGKIQYMIFVCLVLSGLLATFVAIRFSNKITKPIRDVADASRLLSQGEWDVKVTGESFEELGLLASSFEKMRDELGKYIDRIKEEKSKIETILNNLLEGVIILNPEGRIIFFNRIAHELFGFTYEGIESKSVSEVYQGFELSEVLRKLNKGERTEFELDASSMKKILNINIFPVVGDDGKVIANVGMIRDITGFRTLENMRRDFISNASHEMRTPVSSIKALVEALNEGAKDDESLREKFINDLLTQTERLSKLTCELLELSMLESETFIELNREHFSVLDLCFEIEEEMEHLIREKSIDFEVTAFYKGLLYAERSKIKQVMINLIDNAIKYSDSKGKVRVEISMNDDSINVSVTDEGKGIPENDKERIFERFFRVDKERSRSSGGAGLGLSIAKHIIGLHGGRIWAENNSRKGVTVSFLLPS